MASIKPKKRLSVIIPSLNEAKQLPLLLADLHLWNEKIDLIIVDCGSKDKTCLLATLSGARVLHLSEANRGEQLRHGASRAHGDWLFFLHADSRLPENWFFILAELINSSNEGIAWFFEFKVLSKDLSFRLLEFFVWLRSHFKKMPYGDQGLLISRKLYEEIGGYSSIHLMEDIDLIERVNRKAKLKSLGLPLYTNARRWAKKNMIMQTIRNAHLRSLWRNGVSTKELSQRYYK